MFHVKHFKRQIKKVAKKSFLKIDDEKMDRTLDYYLELKRWNEHINLVSPLSLELFPEKHLFPVFVLAGRIKKGGKILDYGAGSGIVGVILRILLDNIDVYLLEARAKRCVFLRHISSALEIPLNVLEGQAKDFSDYHNQFDYVVIRGLKIKKNMFYFLKHGGVLIHLGRTRVSGKFPCERKNINGVVFYFCNPLSGG